MAADGDNDGYVSVDDAYAYAFERARAGGSEQTPQRWLYGAEGSIRIARSLAGVSISPATIPAALRNGLENPLPEVRIGAISALGSWLTSHDPGQRVTARDTLQAMAETDIPRVAEAARTLLGTAPVDVVSVERPVAVRVDEGPSRAEVEPKEERLPELRAVADKNVRNPRTGDRETVDWTALQLPLSTAGSISKWLAKSGAIEKGMPILVMTLDSPTGPVEVKYASPVSGTLSRRRQAGTRVNGRNVLARVT
ncbi:hypothetical protein E0H75_21365 [Kribbella capetownensis]|uniref:EF-hand domain-containing protein n=1 Tax=Kribbella capetownensis TaxID=1572659 RepID=A0A4R0JQK0_9ACTN|nr:hypothetical protein [Kribbella capetownensis]TCC49089.1 hypothetical protein E0H75_21365 [Kribbella capetownensis]